MYFCSVEKCSPGHSISAWKHTLSTEHRRIALLRNHEAQRLCACEVNEQVVGKGREGGAACAVGA